MLRWELYFAIGLVLYFVQYQHFGKQCSLSDNIALRIKVLPQPFIDAQEPTSLGSLAYVQYATNGEYLELAVLNLAQLRRSGTKADLVLLHTQNVLPNELESVALAIESNSIILKQVDLLSFLPGIWQDSFTKLHIFGLPYDRVVYFDADGMLVHFNGTHNEILNIDELFNIPDDIDLAMPQAYWLSTQSLQKTVDQEYDEKKLQSLVCDRHKYDNRLSFFGSHVIVAKPSEKLYLDIIKYVKNPWHWNILSRRLLLATSDYDMEVINKFVDDELRSGTRKFGILDHRVYGVLTGEFRQLDHTRFLREPQFVPLDITTRKWDAFSVLKSTRYIHFSDEPIPKPWKPQDKLAHYNTFKIHCKGTSMEQYTVNKPRETEDCDSVMVWDWVMKTFRETLAIIIQ